MKHALKSIVTMLLMLAIELTGIGMDAVTVNAALINERFTPNGSTTLLEPEDTKNINLIVIDDFGYEVNLTNSYEWTSSDESIVSVKVTHYFDSKEDYVTLTANKTGTATITATFKPTSSAIMSNAYQTASMTVTVDGPKAPLMTAKQKKCRHAYKVTRKATCERTGMNTCKKCKWQVETKKAAHKWVKESWYEEMNTKEYAFIYCTGHDCGDYRLNYLECCEKYGDCPHACNWTSGDCETLEEAYEKWEMHRYEIGKEKIANGTATRFCCKNCGEEVVERKLAE